MSELIEKDMEQEEDTQKDKYLTFLLEKDYYGIEIKYVTEIIGIQTITGVPGQAEYVKGIINLRGRIIPVVDVRLLFKKEEVAYNDRTCIVVVDIREVSIGLIVDSVSEVISIPENDVVPPPQLNKGFQNKYVKGIGKVGNDVKLVLDCERILDNDELESISSVI